MHPQMDYASEYARIHGRAKYAANTVYSCTQECTLYDKDMREYARSENMRREIRWRFTFHEYAMNNTREYENSEYTVCTREDARIGIFLYLLYRCGQCNGEATSPLWLMQIEQVLIEQVYLTSTVCESA